MHPSITIERAESAVKRQMMSLDDPGFCLECGGEADGCEPDASGIECEACGAQAVEGASNVFFMLA